MFMWNKIRSSQLNENSRVRMLNRDGTKMALNYFNADLSIKDDFTEMEECYVIATSGIYQCTLYKNEEGTYVILPFSNVAGNFRYCITDEEGIKNLVEEKTYYSETKNVIDCNKLRSRIVTVKDNTSKEWNVYDCYDSIIYDLKNIDNWIDDRKELGNTEDLYKLVDGKYVKTDDKIYYTDYFLILNNNIYHKNLFNNREVCELNGLSDFYDIISQKADTTIRFTEEQLENFKKIRVNRNKIFYCIYETDEKIMLVSSRFNYHNDKSLKDNLISMFKTNQANVFHYLDKTQFTEETLPEALAKFEKITNDFLLTNTVNDLNNFLEEIRCDDIFNCFAISGSDYLAV